MYITHKALNVGTSSWVKYGSQLHRNMQMWAYTVEGREGGKEGDGGDLFPVCFS